MRLPRPTFLVFDVAAVSELAAPFDMALPSFLQHLQVLEAAGLVDSEKIGRVRRYRLTPEPLRAALGWLGEQKAIWERRLDQLDTPGHHPAPSCSRSTQ